jgi:serine/threonine protein kinase
MLNVLLQTAVGIHYLHRKSFTHHELTPDNIYIEQDKCIKIGNMYNFNGVVSKIAKSPFVGSSPEYWSPEQGGIYDNLKQRDNKDISFYQNSLKLMP